jgi:hypothetical protein
VLYNRVDKYIKKNKNIFGAVTEIKIYKNKIIFMIFSFHYKRVIDHGDRDDISP